MLSIRTLIAVIRSLLVSNESHGRIGLIDSIDSEKKEVTLHSAGSVDQFLNDLTTTYGLNFVSREKKTRVLRDFDREGTFEYYNRTENYELLTLKYKNNELQIRIANRPELELTGDEILDQLKFQLWKAYNNSSASIKGNLPNSVQVLAIVEALKNHQHFAIVQWQEDKWKKQKLERNVFICNGDMSSGVSIELIGSQWSDLGNGINVSISAPYSMFPEIIDFSLLKIPAARVVEAAGLHKVKAILEQHGATDISFVN